MHKHLFFSFLIIYLAGCVTAGSTFTRVAPGMWRGVLELEKFQIPVHDKDTVILLTEQFKPGELPFNFEVTYVDEERFYIDSSMARSASAATAFAMGATAPKPAIR